MTPPADDAALEPGVTLDVRALEHGAPLDADAVLDHGVGADGHVGADAAVGADLGGGVLVREYVNIAIASR